MSSLIQAADRINQEEGFENITIRKVSQHAKLNSATIYNYFQDLDHLLFFMSMKYLSKYTQGVQQIAKNTKDAKELYFAIWSFFIDEAFDNPKMFYHIFFSDKYRDQVDVTMEAYYEIFPEESFSNSGITKKMYSGKNIYNRNLVLLEELAKEDIINPQDIPRINTGTIYCFQAVLNDLRLGIDYDHFKEELKDIMEFFITGKWKR